MCRGYFSSQEIDAHHATEHRSTDQSRNGCGMCCFCHAQPFEITRAEKIKSTLLQHSRQNAKVVEAFCHAACRLSNQCRPSIHQPPVDEFRMPDSTRCTAGCHTSRDFVPWRFSDAGRRSAWIASSCRRPKTYTRTEVRQMSFLDPRRAKKKDRLAAVSPSLTDARSSSSLERFPRSLIGAIEGSSRFRQSRHECGP